MNLVGYTATALSRNDIEDTPTNKNVVDFAIVELKDLQGNLVTIYDDAEGANPETQKTCDIDGQLTFFAEIGDYNLEINGKAQRINLAANIADYIKLSTGESVQEFSDSFALKVFQSPTDGGLTKIQTRTVEGGEVYEVRKTSDNSLATIYSNAADTTEIVQNGTDNKSGSDGVVEFYIADGSYYISSGSESENFNTSNLSSSDGLNTITVGALGDFQTITEALVKSLSILRLSKQKVTLRLLSGFIMQEQVDFEGVHFGGVEIISDDALVTISRSALSVKNGRWYAAFRFKRCTTPAISALFEMDSTGDGSLRVGLYLISSFCLVSPDCGINNSAERGADVTQCSSLTCPTAQFKNSGTIGLRVATGSRCFSQFADVSGSQFGVSIGSSGSLSGADMNISNCSAIAVSAQGGTTLELNGANITNAGLEAIFSEHPCVINANDATLNSLSGDTAQVSGGATLNLNGATLTGAGVGIGVSCETGATVNLEGATVTGYEFNVRARRGGKVTAQSANLTGAATNGIFATESGEIVADYANFRMEASDSASDALVLNGGTISAIGATGGVSKTPNLLNEDGLIKNTSIIRNSGAATISSGKTSVIVNHGLDVQPFSTEIEVGAANGLGDAIKYWITSVGVTSFTIRVDQDPGSDALFRWRAEKLS